MLKNFFDKLSEEIVFLILFIFLFISMFFRTPDIKSIDLAVIAALFNLMLVAIAFEYENFLDYIALTVAKKFHSEKKLVFAMIFTSMFISMFMTNDVALLTLVPITILIGKKGNFNPYKIVAFETVAANLGSALTPFGNPQNIFIFNFFKINTFDFMKMTIPFTVVSVIAMCILANFTSKKKIEFELKDVEIKSKKRVYIYGFLFILAIFSIVHLISYKIVTLIIITSFIFMNKKLILNVDYFLLGTFILFFLLIDNIASFETLKTFFEKILNSDRKIMWYSAISSQGLSNVPTAILFSPFVKSAKALLWGVSLGGLGTLVASLANLISYKLYIKEYSKKEYFSYFTKINIILFITIGVIINFMI